MSYIVNYPLNLNSIKYLFTKFLYRFFNIKIKWRNNYLNYSHYIKTKRIIKKGDLILVGDFKTISGLFMGKYFTHSLIYIGNGKCIHACGRGVQKILLKKVFNIYDTLTILRLDREDSYEKKVKEIIKFAKKQVGKPYDFYLKSSDDKFFCTNLVNMSFFKAGVKTGLKLNTKKYWLPLRLKKALRADDFLKTNLKIVYSTNNIKV